MAPTRRLKRLFALGVLLASAFVNITLNVPAVPPAHAVADGGTPTVVCGGGGWPC